MTRTQAGEHADMVALTGINGQTFDMERIDVETKLGTSEVWEVVSAGMAHPFHIHGALFRILSIAGTPPPAHLTGWKDVVLVEDRAELLVAFNQPATRHHPFMYHCHILEHEEAGLMDSTCARDASGGSEHGKLMHRSKIESQCPTWVLCHE